MTYGFAINGCLNDQPIFARFCVGLNDAFIVGGTGLVLECSTGNRLTRLGGLQGCVQAWPYHLGASNARRHQNVFLLYEPVFLKRDGKFSAPVQR